MIKAKRKSDDGKIIFSKVIACFLQGLLTIFTDKKMVGVGGVDTRAKPAVSASNASATQAKVSNPIFLQTQKNDQGKKKKR